MSRAEVIQYVKTNAGVIGYVSGGTSLDGGTRVVEALDMAS